MCRCRYETLWLGKSFACCFEVLRIGFFFVGFDLLFLMGNIWPTARSAGAMYVQLICSACRVHFYLGELTFFLDFVELLLILRRDQSGKLAVLIGTN